MDEVFDVRRNESDRVLSSSELTVAAKGCEVAFVSAQDRLPCSTIRALLPELRCIATLSVGHEHIDLDACRDLGVAALHTPDVLTEAVADLALMLILNVARRAFEGDHLVRTGAWEGSAPTQLLGCQLGGRKVGIFGMGASGGLRPGVPQLRKALNARRVSQMPENGIIVNVSRGDIVDDDALIEALASGHLFGASLDVFANEPQIDPRYRELSNVFLTPYLGSGTYETRDAMGFLLLEGLAALARGERPHNQLV